MKKGNTYLIPWGWLTLISFVANLIACYRALTPGSARWWIDAFVYGMPVFIVCLAFWAVRLWRDTNNKLNGDKSSIPWWYGGL